MDQTPHISNMGRPLRAKHMLLLTLWLTSACSDSAPNAGTEEVVAIVRDSDARAGSAAPDMPAAPPREASGRSPADLPAAAPSSPMDGAGKAPQAPTADPKPASAPNRAAADDCSARIVSRSKPCSNDPDPCNLNSGWDGDEYCLLPPPPDEGIQLHFGPKSYDDADTEPYVIGPQQWLNDSMSTRVPLDSDRYIGRITIHMRPAMDHWISMSGPADVAEGIYEGTGCGSNQTFGVNGFGGGHNLIYDDPPQGVPAPENAAIVRKILGNSSMCMGLSSINSTDKPRLREAWVNLYFAEAPKEPLKATGIGVIGQLGLAVPAGEKHVSTYEGTFEGNGRIIQLFGHRRQWTKRFAVWLNDELIYDSRRWEEGVVYNFDSITKNPPIDPAGLEDGAVSGILPFKAGDKLKLSCFVENTSGEVLRFRTDLESGEMCNLWGSAVGGGLSGMF